MTVCQLAESIYPRAFGLPYSGSEYLYDSVSIGESIEAIVATGTVKWDNSPNALWPGTLTEFDDFDRNLNLGTSSEEYSAVILHLLPFDDYAKATMYGFRVSGNNTFLTTDGGTINSAVMSMSESSRDNDLYTALSFRNN